MNSQFSKTIRSMAAITLFFSFISSMTMAQKSGEHVQFGQTPEDSIKSSEKLASYSERPQAENGSLPMAAPANDNFANAHNLTFDSVAATNVEATAEPTEPFHGAGHGGILTSQNNSVWFKITRGVSGVVTVWTESSGPGSLSDTVISAYSGETIGGLGVPSAENDDYPGMAGYSKITFWVFMNKTYYIAVDGYQTSTGPFTLHYSYSTFPANDHFANAENVGSTVSSPYIGITGTNFNATEEPGEPEHGMYPNNRSIWYRWTAPESRSTTFSTLGSGLASSLSVYTGSSVDSLSLVARNTEFFAGAIPRSRVTFFATAGVTYRIAIDSKFNATGNSLLSWYPNREESGKRYDFDGDQKSDISIFRPLNGISQWWIKKSTGGHFGVSFATAAGDVVPADFTGDGKTEIAQFVPFDGNWYVLRSDDFTYFAFPFGTQGDIATSGHFDDDAKADFGIFRPSTGVWWILASHDGVSARPFGMAGDIPVAADYDGDGRTDVAIYRPSNGQWWVDRSTLGVVAAAFGAPGDFVVPGAYTGDGRTNAAVWRPSTGEWFILRSLEGGSYYGFPFGASTDMPSPGDYDGDGKFDVAVFRGTTGTWYVHNSQSGNVSVVQFGAPGDQPIAASRHYY